MFALGIETAAPNDAVHDAAWEGIDASLDRALAVFLTQRTRLFRVAHRITGDIGSAEDVVQEAWLRWQRTDRSGIKNPAAFLTTTTTHLAINVIQSARFRHEAPTESPMQAFPVDADNPDRLAEQAAVVHETLLVLMARLTPAELAVYLLRKSFDYPYTDIARLLHTSNANARQLVRRAQQRIESDRQRPVNQESHRELVGAFLLAARSGDLLPLERVLSQGSVGCPLPRVIGGARARSRAERSRPPAQLRSA